jgi:UDP-N-acetylmuramoyl-tripeptide--D-alanyl-D-alanine ligase
MHIEQLYKIFLQHPSVQTDTRKLKPNELFFALKGPSFNGNSFAEKAIASGAAYAIIDEKVPMDTGIENSGRTILVDDVLTVLQQLAQHHRKQFNIPVLAITGSNGKTTTKELIHAVLSSTYKTCTTEGNLNNHIGVPLTLLKIKRDAEMVIIEMGANHLKEIAGYCKIARPTHGLITNCGKAHLEGFGSEEGVRKGKGELFDFLRNNNGTAFIMWDYDYLQNMSSGIVNKIKYGTHDADITGIAGNSELFLTVKMTKGFSNSIIKTQLVGDYNLPNVLAAVAVGKHFRVDEEKIISSIENYVPTNSRSQLLKKDSNTFILDAYNANPSSMKLAIENFANTSADKKILVLGAMAELGNESLDEHEQIIELIKKHTWENVILVGGDFLKLNHPFTSFENSLQAKKWFTEKKFENTHFLIKGSRSMKMEKLIEE